LQSAHRVILFIEAARASAIERAHNAPDAQSVRTVGPAREGHS